MTPSLRLGFMTHSEGPGDPRRIYAETLDLVVAAEQLGYDAIWLAQHHFKERGGRLPSPFPFLAAAAQRTTRLRLGTAVIVLPLEEPLRVAEDAAVVDALSNGRLELGVGSGGDPDEFDAFARPLDSRRQRTAEGIDLLRRALSGEVVGSRGQRLQPPAPTLAHRLWQGVMSAESAQQVAANGLGLMLARSAIDPVHTTDELQLALATVYLKAWDSRNGAPRIGLSRTVYPAADRASALAAMQEGVMRNVRSLIAQGQLRPGLSLEQYCARLNIVYGHPQEIVETLRADRVLPSATDLIVQFSPAEPSHQEALRMLGQIAVEIAPHLHEALCRASSPLVA